MVTINDAVLNEGTKDEYRRPYEILLNSKNLGNYQWVIALVALISMCFRRGVDAISVADELKGVIDPRGGYWQPGGKYMPSIIAEVGYVIERHVHQHQKKID